LHTSHVNLFVHLNTFVAMPFTPIESGVGGALIGLSAGLAYVVDGKLAGISGILGPFLRSSVKCQNLEGSHLWKGLFLLGLVVGGIADALWNPSFSFPEAIDFSPIRYVLAGVSIGIGTRMGKGCTSGHGICGLARFSLRSWIAVPVFMGVASLTVIVTRHVLEIDDHLPSGVAELQWPPGHWQFPLASVGAAIFLVLAVALSPRKGQPHVSSLASGLIFGLGLGASGMTSQAKVLDFLDFLGAWDPSLAFVMGGGLCITFPVMWWSGREGQGPVNGSFEKPPMKGDYVMLAVGSAMFGLGWGLVGMCPGPAVVGFFPHLVRGWGAGLSYGLCFLCICASWLITDRVLQKLLAPKTSSQAPEVTKVQVGGANAEGQDSGQDAVECGGGEDGASGGV